jgi:hypothetical protein
VNGDLRQPLGVRALVTPGDGADELARAIMDLDELVEDPRVARLVEVIGRIAVVESPVVGTYVLHRRDVVAGLDAAVGLLGGFTRAMKNRDTSKDRVDLLHRALERYAQTLLKLYGDDLAVVRDDGDQAVSPVDAVAIDT